jgi:DNA-binding Xre family transcriptional regulator
MSSDKLERIKQQLIESDMLKRELDEEERKFSNNLKQLMNEKGIDNEDLALSVGLEPVVICMIKDCKLRPQRSTVENIARALGVSPGELWEGFVSFV